MIHALFIQGVSSLIALASQGLFKSLGWNFMEEGERGSGMESRRRRGRRRIGLGAVLLLESMLVKTALFLHSDVPD